MGFGDKQYYGMNPKLPYIQKFPGHDRSKYLFYTPDSTLLNQLYGVKAHLQLVVRASTTGLRAKNGKFPCDAHARRARVAAIRVRVDLLYDKNLKQF